jgi:hypothetical protein
VEETSAGMEVGLQLPDGKVYKEAPMRPCSTTWDTMDGRGEQSVEATTAHYLGHGIGWSGRLSTQVGVRGSMLDLSK